MSTCNTWEAPYRIDGSHQANDPASGCSSYAAQFGVTSGASIIDGLCTWSHPDWGLQQNSVQQMCEPAETPEPTEGGNVIKCDHACTVSLAITPAPADAGNLSDLTAMAGLFTLAAIVIFTSRKLYDLFDKAPHGD